MVACGRENANEGKRGGEMVNKKCRLWMTDFNSMEGKRGSGKLRGNATKFGEAFLEVIIKLWCIQCVNVLELCFAFVESAL